jgi:hypothetical protein
LYSLILLPVNLSLPSEIVTSRYGAWPGLSFRSIEPLVAIVRNDPSLAAAAPWTAPAARLCVWLLLRLSTAMPIFLIAPHGGKGAVYLSSGEGSVEMCLGRGDKCVCREVAL